MIDDITLMDAVAEKLAPLHRMGRPDEETMPAALKDARSKHARFEHDHQLAWDRWRAAERAAARAVDSTTWRAAYDAREKAQNEMGMYELGERFWREHAEALEWEWLRDFLLVAARSAVEEALTPDHPARKTKRRAAAG